VITAKSAHGVACTSLRRLGHPARALDWVPRIILFFCFFPQWPSPPGRRLPGLPIRDCTRSCNNREHTRTQLSAIDVTEKAFFERLYLVLGLSPFEPRVNCPYSPTPPPLAPQLFLDFRAIFFPSGPSVVVSNETPRNVAESRYPLRESARLPTGLVLTNLSEAHPGKKNQHKLRNNKQQLQIE